jgi:hypothetical protein
MGAEGERGRRAGDYISGRLNDAERERAERDLTLDPDFRDAVMRLADEMRSSGKPGVEGEADRRWEAVAQRLADLPQMRPVVSDKAAPGRAGRFSPFGKPIGMGLHAVPGRKALVVTFGLIAAFALGYVTRKL